MKILITGGTNFVSRYTAEYFAAKGCDVTVLNRGSRPQPAGVTHICCDKLQLGDTLKGAHYDAVLDITGYTEEHVKAIVDSGVTFGDYVFISSSAVYPETNAQPFSEDQEIGHNSVWGDYGENKVKAERFLREKCRALTFSVRPTCTEFTTTYTVRLSLSTARFRTDLSTFPATAA